MFPMATILHPTDFSERSGHAFRLACSLARDHGSRLVVLHIGQLLPISPGEGVFPPLPWARQEELLGKLQQLRAQPPQVRMETHLVFAGDPAAEILRFAQDIACDLIVMGTHGRTGLGRLLMGSVAEQVVRCASCPVLTVRNPFPQVPASRESIPQPAASTLETR
jgi:nucleotide-binding universal stress UspA family protein